MPHKVMKSVMRSHRTGRPSKGTKAKRVPRGVRSGVRKLIRKYRGKK